MKISHSIVSESSLREMIEECYVLGDSIECTYILQGLNDSYLIVSGGKKYVFRIYRYGRRTLDSIKSEIEYISYLDQQSTLVAGPISDMHGDILKSFDCPEGIRYGFLMDCAANTELENHCILTGKSYEYGRSVAIMHKHSSDFKPREKFRDVDLDHLIWKPLSLAERHFPGADISYAKNIAIRVKNELDNLNREGLTKSFIHADLAGGNACLSY